jgi:peptidoglycan/xylan/chitin deacetylase (PgdA/CDA1 family)
MEKILTVLEKFNIPATFFFTGDTARNNKGWVIEISRKGYEVGCHSLHHETVGDVSFNMPNDNPILEEEMENRLRKNIEIVTCLTKKQPISFRAPRFWQGTAQIRVLEQLGFKTDASYSVAAHKKQIVPYHPSETN